MKIKIPHSLRLSNLVYNKRFTIPLSIILSFALWLGISMVQNPIRTQTFTDVTASISVEGTLASEMGLGIVSDVASQKYTVTVSGPNYAVSSLKSDDFILSASLVDINSPGTYSLDVIGINNSNKTGYSFASISPSTINVTFDYIDAKEFTLVPKLIGVSAAEGLVAETPIVSETQKSTVTIRGPRTTMEKIAYVGTIAEVNETLSTTQSYDSDIVLYDSNDKIIYRFTSDGNVYDANDNIITNSFLNLSFTSVKVLQPISKTATLPCKAVFNNIPEGMTENDVSYKIDYDKVTVIGTPDVIDKMTSVSLSPIDFRTISTTSNVFEVSETLPDGVKLLDNIDCFTVDIDVSKYAETTIEIKNIRCIGLGADYKSKTDSRISNVKICGPKETIENIKASDFFAVVDLTDKSVGDHTVEVVIKSDVYKNVWQVGYYSSTITVS